MLDATERKTLAWSAFIAGVLLVIPGETPRGPRIADYAIQILGRFLDHHATQISWALCVAFVAHHLWKSKKEEKAAAPAPAPPAVNPETSG